MGVLSFICKRALFQWVSLSHHPCAISLFSQESAMNQAGKRALCLEVSVPINFAPYRSSQFQRSFLLFCCFPVIFFLAKESFFYTPNYVIYLYIYKSVHIYIYIYTYTTSHIHKELICKRALLIYP